ncbi:MAG TPA: hypothetical protein VGK58_22260 [Lacipirellulaceae bacterium]
MSDSIANRSLPEHPEDARRRLRELNVWPGDAKSLFDKERQARYFVYRKGGTKPTLNQTIEANYGAWMAVFAKWPSPAGARPCDSLSEYLSHETPCARRTPKLTAEAQRRFDSIKKAADHGQEIQWVYSNISNKLVDPLECPSRGAWDLLLMARKNRKWFYEKIYKSFAIEAEKRKAKREGQDDINEPSPRERLAVEDMERMLSDLKAQAERVVCPECGAIVQGSAA